MGSSPVLRVIDLAERGSHTLNLHDPRRYNRVCSNSAEIYCSVMQLSPAEVSSSRFLMVDLSPKVSWCGSFNISPITVASRGCTLIMI